MKNIMIIGAIFISMLSGCASVPMESEPASNKAKQFNAPSPNMAGVYVYRADSHFGAALKKDVWIDSKCLGETAKGVFFYEEVEGDKQHSFSTESEFSPNDLIVKTLKGQLYFIEQYIKFGAFVGGAGLELKDPNVGKKEIAELKMAKKGTCSE